MVTLTTSRRFYDLKAHRWRTPGEEFTASEERAAQIEAALPGFAVVLEPEAPDLSEMTVSQLREMCAERGIRVPRQAKKEDIIELLED